MVDLVVVKPDERYSKARLTVRYPSISHPYKYSNNSKDKVFYQLLPVCYEF